MRNLKILFKNNFNMLLGRLQGKKKRASTTTAVLLLVLGVVGIFALYSLQAWSMFEGLGKLGLGKLCVFHGIITTITVILIIGIMRVTGKTKGGDADFLLSLPIKKRDIIISKLFSQYVLDLFFTVVFLLPFIVFYEITAPVFSLSVLIFGLLTVLMLPLLSVGISQIMEFIVVRLFNKVKAGNVLKALVPTIIYIALTVLLLIKTSGYGSVEFDSMESYFADRWVSNQLLSFVFDQSLVSILVFVGLTIVPGIIGVILQTNIYGKNFGVYVNKKESFELTKKQKPFSHLLKKEVTSYFTLPVYLVNTIIGPILIIVISVVAAIFGIESLLSTLQISISSTDLTYICAAIINLLIGTTCISCVSISLEGNTIWFLKSLPVRTNQVFLAKLFVPLIIVVPSLLVSSTIFGIILGSVLSGVIIFAVTLLFLLLTDTMGLMINLWCPKLNWENEIQVVKQSLSVFLSMTANTVFALLPIAIYLIFGISISLVAFISIAIYAISLIIFNWLLFTNGKTIFNKLEQ